MLMGCCAAALEHYDGHGAFHACMLAIPGAMRLCVLRQGLCRCAWLYWDRLVLATCDICVLATAPTRALAKASAFAWGQLPTVLSGGKAPSRTTFHRRDARDVPR